jgi:hypothetical protein
MNEPGEFTLVGVFGGSTKTEAELESEEDEMTIAYSETLIVCVRPRRGSPMGRYL